MSDNTFRCYVYKSRGSYYAICLDLTLIDKRGTLEEAIAALDEDILGYLESARASGRESQLVPRPCPRREWLRYYGLYLLNAFAALLGKRVADFMSYSRKQVATDLSQEMRLVYA